MKISRNTRPARAGAHMADSIIENVHLMFFNDNALQYLQLLTELLNAEFEARKREADRKEAED